MLAQVFSPCAAKSTTMSYLPGRSARAPRAGRARDVEKMQRLVDDDES